MVKLLVLHGPNLNLLGKREPEVYGSQTLTEINNQLQVAGKGHYIEIIQSNAEHVLIDAIHQAWQDNVQGIIINPAAFTHTSIAIRDALLATSIPFVEIHLSNIFARESFRQHSYFSDIALGVISGFGAQGYISALQLLINTLESR